MDVRKKLTLFTLRLIQDSDSRMSQLKLRRQKRIKIIRRRLDTIRRRQSINRMQLVLILVGFIARSACVPVVREFWTVPK